MRIKNILGMLLLATAVTGLYSCSDEDGKEVDNGLRTGNATKLEILRDSVPVSDLSFSIGRGAAILGINADGSWTAELDDTTCCNPGLHAW